ncbi:hypothetical protein [Chryseobacterium polytrichastri]|uniref:DUF3828 domain-containing protein n=1 Tax=Chryseobacterium polytrichastri TaxID=1302687 RepID=A0A1M7FPT2_9FLAO|nr:hypothetical protein [Chryseobacterium polytrichastri]SHM06132.1 hypothetical protein SAMN05444267_103310 [Chryseobacterium polytrichastri]
MKLIILSSLFLMIACKEKETEKRSEYKAPTKENPISENKSNESEDAKKWLTESIEKFFKTDLSTMDSAMQNITTKDYYEYKTDATNVEMDTEGSLTEKEFEQKWKSKFNIEKAGTGVGFLISGQDWNEIKVSKCNFISQDGNTYLFDVILEDKEYKAEYPIQVKVVKEKEGFRIADVLQ